MEIILEIFGFIFGLITNMFHLILDLFRKSKVFNAKWGKERSIGRIWNKGLLFSRNRKTTRKAAFENMYISGPTGSGKTARILIKQICSLKNCTLIINDPSGELRKKTSGYLARRRKPLFLCWTDSRISAGYNFLSGIKKSSDIHRIAALLVDATLGKGQSNDPFWSLQSKALIAILIRVVLHQPEEFQTMPNILRALKILAVHPNSFDVWVATSGDKKLILEYKTLLAMPEKTLMNVIASVKACLQIFEDEDIAAVCSTNSIDFSKIRQEPTVIFLGNSLKDMKYTSVLTELFFEQLYGYLLENQPRKGDLDCFVILEEASSIKIPILPVAVANTRKMSVGNVIVSQSFNYLKAIYKEEADNIVTQCGTKLYLPGTTEIETMKELELLSGLTQFQDENGTHTRPLISAAEVRLLPKNRTIIMQGNKPLVKGRTAPYFKSLKYRYLTHFKPVDSESPANTEPQLLMAFEMNEYESTQQKQSAPAVSK